MCTEFFSLEMNIPFVENREEQILEVDSVFKEKGNIGKEENEEDDLSVFNNSSEEIFNVINGNRDNDDEVFMIKNKKMPYSVKLVMLVQLFLYISLAIIFLSFICMICIYFC